MKESQMVNTEMLKRWRFKRLPFVNRPIREDSDSLFANREMKLKEIAFAEGHGLVCLYGVQGIGKTSLFHKYRRSVNRRKKDKTDSLYAEIVPQKDRIMIQILRSVLVAIRDDILHVNNKSKLEVEQKLEQMDRIKTTTDALLGKVGAGELVKILVNLGAETSRQTSVVFNPITDANAAEELVPLLSAVNKKAVLVFDNLEKVANIIEAGDYVEQVSQLSQLLEGTFDPDLVTICIAVDQRFIDQINRDDVDEIATHSFQRLVEVNPLSLPDTEDLIRRRLEWTGYTSSLESFIGQTAVESLQNLTKGHPRGIISVLGYAIEAGYERKSLQLNHGLILVSFEKARRAGLFGSKGLGREAINATDVTILEYIRAQGAQWASNESFQNAVGLNKSQLSQHLNQLEAQGMLTSNLEKKGKTRIKMFGIP